MPTDPMALVNALNPNQDPSVYYNQLQAQQQQALANALLQQGITPMGGTESVGGVAIRRSPLEGAAKLAALLSGQSLQGQANDKSVQGMMQQAQALRYAMGADQGQQGGQMAPEGQPSSSGMPPGMAPQQGMPPTQGAGAYRLPGMSPQQALLAMLQDSKGYNDAFIKGYTPNETTIAARQGGVDPMVANRLKLIKESTDPKILGMQQAGMTAEMVYRAIYGEAAKNAEIDRKKGNEFINGLTGANGIVPDLPANANPVGSPLPNGAIPGVSQIPGAPGVVAGNSAAGVAGTNSQTPSTAYVDGQPAYSTKAMDVQRANQVAPGVQASRDSEALRIVQSELAAEKDPVARAALQREVQRLSGAAMPELAPGVSAGANDAQKQLGDRFGALRDSVATAQTTNSYLDNIKQLSTVAATGKFSDRLDYVNALLAPFNEKANDAKTANDLLNKYSNQIVSRLSTGGLGTDAARTILGSAYPNAHMTKDAIGEAVDNIKAVNEMQKAKLTLLSAPGNARDAAGYQQREATFDKVADPRIWQLQGMSAQQAQSFLAKMPPAAQAELRQRAQALKQIGAL